MKIIPRNEAWALASISEIEVPERGMGAKLHDGRFLSHGRDGYWRVFDSLKECTDWALTLPKNNMNLIKAPISFEVEVFMAGIWQSYCDGKSESDIAKETDTPLEIIQDIIKEWKRRTKTS